MGRRIEIGEKMKYCVKCKTTVLGKRAYCPLCQSELKRIEKVTMADVEIEKEEEIFPYVPTIYQKYHMFFKIMIFISIAVVVITFFLNLLLTPKTMWAVVVLGGILCFWVMVFFIFAKRKNAAKNILYQVVIISLISAIWDYFTGWNQWSIDFVIPILCLAALLGIAVMSKIIYSEIEDYLIYLLIGSVFGIVPIVFYALGMVTIVFPSLLCVASSILFLSAILVFQGERMMSELKRRLHL